MNTLIALFFLSFILCLILTPYMGKIAMHFGIVDVPMARKIHGRPIPRIGGAAMFLSFSLPFSGAFFIYTDLLKEIVENPAITWLGAGALIVFLLGLWDDIRRLPALVKLIVQIAAALVAYGGGLRIESVLLPGGYELSFSYLSLIMTIFWFVLVVNAINLIDGLDGLAAGVVLFSSLVLLVLSIYGGRFIVAMGFAALAGSTMGFLRYNFNPASIFMGDSGSYFLGFMLAGLSIMGSIKGQTAVALLIPIIAMGVPLFDTIIAPVRRFVRGKPMFQADRSHLHHRLLRLGLNHRNTVLILYGATVVLCLLALAIMFFRDFWASVILGLIAVAIFLAVRKIGYLEYLAVDKIGGYLYDMGDLMGVTTHRRTFLDRQIEIDGAQDYETLWQHTISALELLKIDRARMCINGKFWTMTARQSAMDNGGNVDADAQAQNGDAGSIAELAKGDPLTEDNSLSTQDGRLVISLPLVDGDGKKTYGALYLEKDLARDPLAPFTLRRIEHLRRSLTSALKKLSNK